MGLVLYYHPLASFCHKVLIALHENGTPFEGRIIDLGDERSRAELVAVWPLAKFPVLRDDARARTVPETSIIIEYLARHYPGPVPLLPTDPDEALEARLWDRFFDSYVSAPMQKIVAAELRPSSAEDVAEARATLQCAYDILETRLADRAWAAGAAFGLADCAAAPALFYADIVAPFSRTHATLAGYYERLLARPSVARTLREARPYFELFPLRDAIPARFLGEAR